MDQASFQRTMNDLKKEALQIYKASTPVLTGYQKDHIYAKDLANGGFEIVVDTDYVQYTTDQRKDGSINPNEGWDKEAGALFISRAKAQLNGTTVKKRSEK